MRDFLQALSFLTILPFGRSLSPEEKGLARSMAFYPLAGFVIGGLSALGFYLLSFLFPGPLVLWLTLGLLALLTGGLHLDGFADTIDGLACRGTKEKALAVMRDSRVGAFGVMGLILLIGAKYLALVHLPGQAIPSALILMAVTGRNSMVLVCYRSSYARSTGGLAKSFVENLGLQQVVVSFASALGIASLVMGIKGILAILLAGLFSLGYRIFFVRRLGGVTGDILGAANELAELLCLLLLILLENVGV